MVDLSFAGINELRVYWKDEVDDNFVPKRAVSITGEDYGYALSGAMLFILSMHAVYFMSFRWTGAAGIMQRGSSETAWANCAFKLKPLLVMGSLILSIVCGIIGSVSLWATEAVVDVPIKHMPENADLGSGSGFEMGLTANATVNNMVLLDADAVGERFSLNLYHSINAYGAPEASYTGEGEAMGSKAATDAYMNTDGYSWWYNVVFFFTGLSYMCWLMAASALIFADDKSVKLLMLLGSVLEGALIYAFIYGAADQQGKDYCIDMDTGSSYPNEEDCRQVTNGFFWISLQGVMLWFAGFVMAQVAPESGEPAGEDAEESTLQGEASAVTEATEGEQALPETPADQQQQISRV